jgi:hypothetical protein
VKRVSALSIPLALAACAAKPLPHVQIQYVDRPVAVPCIDAKDVPRKPGPVGKLPGDARQAADILGAKLSEVNPVVDSLYALIGPCTRAP